MNSEKSDEHILVERLPTVEEYLSFRRAVGWNDVDEDTAREGLQGSLFSVCAMKGEQTIGCGRVVGDGAIYFYIQDIMVMPGFQGQGIGKSIMEAVMGYLREHARSGSFVGLMAASGAAGFYPGYGFRERAPDGPGMFLVWE